jgi:tripartite-type tricarboxylate transporter receptor subunit TctC
MHRRSLIRSAAAAGLLPGASRAQSFPSKQLRLLVGAAAGGGADIVARIMVQEMTKSGGLSVMVDNKPGAGGTLATREMLRAPADGHTLLVANVGVLAVIPYATKDAGTSWSSIPAYRPGRSPSISRWPGARTAWITARRASAAPAISPASC